MKEIIIDRLNAGQRVDKLVRKWLGEAPLSFIYHLFRKKDVKINGKWVPIEYIVSEGEVLRIYISDKQLQEFNKPRSGVVKGMLIHPIVYEDDSVLIVVKPKGLLIHGEEGESHQTLSNDVLGYLYYKGEYNPSQPGFVPSPAHRLDRNTSGLVIFGKTMGALQSLDRAFSQRDCIHKSYLALVVGKVDEPGLVDLNLFKGENELMMRIATPQEKGLKAITQYKPLEFINGYSLLSITIITGRTHQIRLHMKEVGFPLVGDAKYGDFSSNDIMKREYGYQYQFLHAYQISFEKMEPPLSYLNDHQFTAPLPKEEEMLLNKLRIVKSINS